MSVPSARMPWAPSSSYLDGSSVTANPWRRISGPKVTCGDTSPVPTTAAFCVSLPRVPLYDSQQDKLASSHSEPRATSPHLDQLGGGEAA